MATSDVAILNERGELLLQLRAKDNFWGLIGGFMELGETVEGTARREVLEGTGLQLGKLELLGVFSDADYLTYSNGDQVQLVTVAFFTADVTGTPRLSSEGLELRYFALDAKTFLCRIYRSLRRFRRVLEGIDRVRGAYWW